MAMYAKGVQLYCAPTADDRETWLSTIRHIALEGRCFVLSSCQFLRRSDLPADIPNRISDDPEAVLMRGGSAIVDPFGTVLAGPCFEGETILYADLDLDQVVQRGGGTERHDPSVAHRDRPVAELGERLVVASVQESIDKGRVVEQTGPRASRTQLQTTTLLDAIEEHSFDAAMGGARRDEERARAKERIFSFRDDFGQWNPRAQRPELWNLYNARVRRGEHVRVFPISNWTELDVWQYIAREQLELPEIYFAHERDVFRRDGMIYAASDFVVRLEGEQPFPATVRFRTVGDMSCTGGVESNAATIDEVVAEIAATRITERGETRADDRVSEAAMEDRKRVGYF